MDGDEAAALRAQIAALPAAVQALAGAKRAAPDLTVAALGSRQCSTLRRPDYLTFRDERAKKVGVGTLNQELTQAHAMFRWGVAGEHIEANPIEGVRRLKGQHARETEIDPMEHARAFADAPLLLRVFQAVCIETGLRNGCEARLLERSHIDTLRSVIRVPKTNAKGKTTTREVPMSDYLADLLDELPEVIGSPYVFANPQTRQPYSYAYLNRSCRPYLDRLRAASGDERVVTHDARHSFVSRLHRGGLDLFASMKISGHRTAGQHFRYHHVSAEDKAKAKSLLDEERKSPKASPVGTEQKVTSSR